MRHQTPCLVIAASPFSESSQVVQLLTERDGFVTALARGTHREKSAFGGALDVLTAGVADLTTRRTSELELLHSFAIDRPYRGLRGSLDLWLAGSHVLELVRPFAWPKDRARDILLLATATLDVIERATHRDAVDACLAWFASRLLSLAGFEPSLDACAACSTPLVEAPRASFSPRAGGALCSDCATKAHDGRDKSAIVLTRSALDLLLRLRGAAGSPSSAVAAPSPEDVLIARRVLARFAEERLERRLSASRWLAEGVPSFQA